MRENFMSLIFSLDLSGTDRPPNHIATANVFGMRFEHDYTLEALKTGGFNVKWNDKPSSIEFHNDGTILAKRGLPPMEITSTVVTIGQAFRLTRGPADHYLAPLVLGIRELLPDCKVYSEPWSSPSGDDVDSVIVVSGVAPGELCVVEDQIYDKFDIPSTVLLRICV